MSEEAYVKCVISVFFTETESRLQVATWMKSLTFPNPLRCDVLFVYGVCSSASRKERPSDFRPAMACCVTVVSQHIRN